MSEEMVAAIIDEIDGQRKRGIFKIVKESDNPVDTNILSHRFVLTMKSECEKWKCKAWFVVEGSRDSMRQYIVYQSQTIPPSTIRLILALAAAYSSNL